MCKYFVGICQTSPNTVLLCKWRVTKPALAGEYLIEDGRFGQMKREIKFPLHNIYGIVSAWCGTKKIIVITSWQVGYRI